MGHVYLYTGTGAGKTTNALGLALRSIDHGKKVVIIQFFKWRKDIGEYLIKDKLGPYYEIYQFGRLVWLGKKEKTEEFAGEKFKVESFKDVDKELTKIISEKIAAIEGVEKICPAIILEQLKE